MQYNGRPAYRLTDGRTEVIVVPELGRVMRYGLVGGANMLWNAAPGRHFKADEWQNWGGDKVWPAPQSQWPGLSGRGWPPHPTFDGLPHRAVVSETHLRTTGPLMAGFGVRILRDYSLDPASGDLVIEQTLRKESGVPVLVSLWSVTQIPPPDAVFVPLNPESPYKNNFYWFAGKAPQGSATAPLSPTMLRFRPTLGAYKLGADAPVSAVASVKDGIALVLRARKQEGQHPEGAEGSGFPITVWNQGEQDPAARYVELEMMSPLRALKRGEQLAVTMRWSLHRLPSTDVERSEVPRAVEALLREIPGG
jgi:hypothetical protein